MRHIKEKICSKDKNEKKTKLFLIMTNLIYIFLGENFQNYIIDSIYQSCFINTCQNIHVIIPSKFIEQLKLQINYFNVDASNVKIYNVEEFENGKTKKFIQVLKSKNYISNIEKFRESFWIYTTMRFFVLHSFIEKYNLENVFHIENDVMLYISTEKIKSKITNLEKMYCVQDSPSRVVPSIVFFPNVTSIDDLTNFIIQQYENNEEFLNDMDILGKYNNKNSFEIFPENDDIVFDGACFGQYLGGVDPKNNNGFASPGFVNETSIVKSCNYSYSKQLVVDNNNHKYKLYICRLLDTKSNFSILANLHIHSKQLYKFSSNFDFEMSDIITGDAVFKKCDIVLSTPLKRKYHYNLLHSNIISIENYEQDFEKFYNAINKKNIKVGIYIDELENYQNYFLNKLKDVKIIYYIHNGDYEFNSKYKNLINHPTTLEIYAQNVNIIPNDKVNLLPIGIANNMFKHGDLKQLYSVMSMCFKYKKINGVYTNIDVNTFPYRKVFVDGINKNEIEKLEFKKYLEKLSTHLFATCIRGNGIDTHRFWECLYLNVVPIIIVNKHTRMTNFYKYLELNEIPCCKISSIEEFNNTNFSQELYDTFMKTFSSEKLKIKNYI